MIAIFELLADAAPQHHQRNECDGRHVADEIHRRLEKRFGGLERAGNKSERKRDEERREKAERHALNADRQITGKSFIRDPRPEARQDVQWPGHEHFRNDAGLVDECP